MVFRHKPLTELDADLFAKIVDKVIVNRLSTQVILKNIRPVSKRHTGSRDTGVSEYERCSEHKR